MTRHTPFDGCIDRRTALGLLSGGLAAVAGCNGDSPSGSADDTGTDESDLEYPGSGWIEPAEQSEYITDSEIVADDDHVYLELQLQNAVDITDIGLIDAQNNEFDAAFPDAGSVQIELANDLEVNRYVDEPADPTIITTGENTLVLEFEDDSLQRLPFRLGTSVQFQDIEVVGNGLDLGITVKNTGTHPTVAWRTDYQNIPGGGRVEGPDGNILHLIDPKLIQPGETHTITHSSDIWIGEDCENLDTRTLEFTVRSMWANIITISQRVTYNSRYSCGSLDGEPTVTAGQSTESGNQ